VLRRNTCTDPKTLNTSRLADTKIAKTKEWVDSRKKRRAPNQHYYAIARKDSHHEPIKDREKVDTVARITLATLLGVCLSIGAPPKIIPKDLAFITGVVAACVAFVLPKLLFAVIGALPFVVFIFLLILGVTTGILAAATVSTGFMVVIFALQVFFLSGFGTGKWFEVTSKANILLNVFTGVFSLSYRPLVQEGVPDVIEGGMTMVNQLWKQQGLNNPLASFRNIMICICWGVACVAVAILVPPIRKMRDILSKQLASAAMSMAAARLKEASSGGDMEVFHTKRAQQIEILNKIHGGDAAKVIVYEYRFCEPTDYLLPLMKTLLVSAEKMLMATLVFDISNPLRKHEDEEDCLNPVADLLKKHLEQSAAIVADCAACLKTSDPTLLEKWKMELEEQEPSADFLGKVERSLSRGNT